MAREARRGSGPLGSVIWGLIALLLIVVSGMALPVGPAGGDDPVATLVVGDLLLADADEGPRNGVRATFQGADLAPGDTHTGTLRILTRAPADQGVRLDDGRVLHRSLALDVLASQEGGAGALAGALQVTALTYAGQDLAPRVEQACQQPLTLDTLVTCAGADDALSGLPAPDRDGEDLVLTLRMDPAAGNELQGSLAAFSVEVTLTGRLVDPSPPGPTPAPGAPDPGDRWRSAPDGERLDPANLPAGPGYLCLDLAHDQALVAYVEQVDVDLTCEVVL